MLTREIKIFTKETQEACFINAGTRNQDIYKRNAGGVFHQCWHAKSKYLQKKRRRRVSSMLARESRYLQKKRRRRVSLMLTREIKIFTKETQEACFINAGT